MQWIQKTPRRKPVDPEFRGHHFAEIVCASVIDHYRKHNCKMMYLYTDDYRLSAIKTYLKTGWQPVRDTPDMEKRLDKISKRLD